MLEASHHSALQQFSHACDDPTRNDSKIQKICIRAVSIECRETKTIISNYSGQSQRTKNNPLFNQNSKQSHEAQENLREQVMIGVGFTCDWFLFYF